MIPTIKQNPFLKTVYGAYVVLFFVYLALPLSVVAVFAFNNSQFPSLPWQGFTLTWFFGEDQPWLGVFHGRRILRSIGTSAFVAVWVSVLSVFVGTVNAFLFERTEFRFKSILYVLMLLPLVIPGIILGISILVLSNLAANTVEHAIGWEIEALRPGLILVVLGQFSFITTIATLVISTRLKKFDTSLEEAALNLGATPWQAIWTITLPYLRPAMVGSGIDRKSVA